MKELLEIVAAFESLCEAGKPAALATVIAVEGSAYRRPGARMLVAEDGRTWGGVSGGCLERDVARRALGVIDSQRTLRCRYDTGDDEAITPAASTGCGGTIELFIQPVTPASPGPIHLFRRMLQSRKPLKICTAIRVPISDRTLTAGACFVPDDIVDDPSSGCGIATDRILSGFTSDGDDRAHLVGDALAGEYFIEMLVPPQSLIVFGAGPDVVPVVAIAKTLGWHVTLVGSRPATGITERFATADVLHVTASDDPLAGLIIPEDAAVLLMTHNVARDEAILRQLSGPMRYLGLLGPRHRTRRVLSALPDREISGLSSDRLFAPVGLDLGADTPQEIALSIVAEIQSVVRRATARSLRTRPGPIHLDRASQAVRSRKADPESERMGTTAHNGKSSCPA